VAASSSVGRLPLDARLTGCDAPENSATASLQLALKHLGVFDFTA